ncbi:MAG: hypothetical protein RML32_02240 [Gammaproteobacteria bacterium]|nr:hypothetical protein [Gammaproteobacteria bacterium]
MQSLGFALAIFPAMAALAANAAVERAAQFKVDRHELEHRGAAAFLR